MSVLIPESKRDRIAKYAKMSQVGLNYGGTYWFGIKFSVNLPTLGKIQK
jgi:hypothetical protein